MTARVVRAQWATQEFDQDEQAGRGARSARGARHLCLVPTRSSAGGSVALASALDHDWTQLGLRPACWRGSLALWAQLCTPLTWCQSLDQVLAVCELDDVAGCFLVGRAQGGDQLAGRVVLQALLPRLRTQARLDPAHCLGDYVATAWERIMAHPVATRRRELLVNLALDCLKQLSRADRHRSRELPLLAAADLHVKQPASPIAGDLIDTAVRQGWIPMASGQVLRSVYADGLSGREAAQRHHISEHMVRYRCSSAVRQLRGHRDELALLTR